jgi:hypothetical protein
MRIQLKLIKCLAIAGFVLAPLEASAIGFRGGAVGGGVRVGAAVSFNPGAGVYRSATVAAGRYHIPATLPAYRPGVGYAGAAARTVAAVAITRNVLYRTAGGYSYYYGNPVYAAPSSGCYNVIWEGMSAYSCDGVIYAYENGAYYPIQGA